MSNPITVTVNESGIIAGTTITVSQANIEANGSVAVTVSNSPIASGAGKTVVSSGGIADLTTAQQNGIGEGTVVVTTDGARYIYSGGGSKTNPASYVILADITPDWTAISGKPSTFTPSSHAAAHGSGGADPVTVAISQVTGLQTALDAKASPADVTAAVTAVIDAAPAALDTLNELAAALGDDANFASTVTTALAGKASAVHSHGIADVTGLQTALNGKQAAGSYAASTHTHAIADVTSLQTQLDYRVSSAVPFTANHTDARGSQYQAGDLVHVGGNVWRAIATNDGIVPGIAGSENYWAYVGPGYRLNIDILDIANYWLPPATATDGYVLAWNATNGAWEASAIPTELPSGSAGQLLGHDGTAWVATSLPTASATVLGAVKIGSGVTITDGVISVSTNYATATHTHVAADITDFTTEAAAAAPVQSVAGQTGAVTLSKSDVGLGNVDNTSDADKPVSSATQTALDAKAAASHTHSWSDITTGTPTTLAGYGITDAVASSDSRLTDARTPTAHAHDAADVTSGTLNIARIPTGTTSSTVCIGNDARLTDARTPTSHAHGNITDAGAIGTTSGLPIITTTAGVLTAGAFGSTAGTFCQGNDSRLSDARTPTAHKATHATGGSDALTAADIGAAASSHTHAAADIASGTIADARLPLATAAQALAGASAVTLITPQAMHLSRRGSGRSKFFELFTDFAMTASGISEGSDGFLWGRHVSGTGADCNTYSNRFISFSRPGAGILSMITGTTATGRAGIDSWNDNAIFRFDQGTTTFETLIYIPALATATDDYVLRLGFVQGNALTNDLVAFEYNRSNSVNWHGVTGWNGSYTRVDTGVAVAATKWIMLALEFTSNSLTLRINGTACGTITTNIRPDGGTRLGTHLLKTAGTTSVSVLLDYVYYRHDFSSDRTFTP